jgi:predicted GH43/DUF377 family glycosyl hydrolase
MANETVFKRYEKNPVVTPANVPRANSIHNSAIVRYRGAYAGVFRVDEIDMRYRLHVGFSDDGIDWKIDPDYITMTSDDPEVTVSDWSYDPRVSEIEGVHYLTWCNSCAQGPAIGLARTTDFKTFIQMEPQWRAVPAPHQRQVCHAPSPERPRPHAVRRYLLLREPRSGALGQAPSRVRSVSGMARHKGGTGTVADRDSRGLAADLPRRLGVV